MVWTPSPTSRVPDWISAAAYWPSCSPVARRFAARFCGPREVRIEPVGTLHFPYAWMRTKSRPEGMEAMRPTRRGRAGSGFFRGAGSGVL